MMHAAILLATLAAASHGAEPGWPSLETAMGGLSGLVMSSRARLIQAGTEVSISELDSLASDSRSLQRDAQRLRSGISNLRSRARRYDPNHPSSDSFLRSDLNRAVWDARDLARESRKIRLDADRLARDARPDEALVEPARRFRDAGVWSESDAGWLASETRWAESEFRRAGFSMEVWDLSRYAQEAKENAYEARRDADEILKKVQQSPPSSAR